MLELINKSIRSHDPYVRMENNWLIRPIAAHCGRIDLDEVDPTHPMAVRETEQAKLLRAMGAETANVHLGSVPAKELAEAVKKFSVDDLRRGTKRMLAEIKADFDVWRVACKASAKAQKKSATDSGKKKKP
jgi:hypothetical protein